MEVYASNQQSMDAKIVDLRNGWSTQDWHTVVYNDTSQEFFCKGGAGKPLISDEPISFVNSLFANNLEK